MLLLELLLRLLTRQDRHRVGREPLRLLLVGLLLRPSAGAHGVPGRLLLVRRRLLLLLLLVRVRVHGPPALVLVVAVDGVAAARRGPLVGLRLV